MSRTALVIALCAASGMAYGAEAAQANKYSACLDQSGGVTVEMLDCIDAELVAQDARLNGAYTTLGARLTPDRRQQLVAVQRLWIQYRDANCRFYADPDGGTAATLTANECVLTETTTRAKELEDMMESCAGCGSSPVAE